ncbi:MAG: glycosyltransferase family 2 protein, partial [Candidatus Omnitrophica bacterium]|nr:glycosyltransferase family 2 protein [Candidatus Omnitrophota bacterium]
EKIALCLESVKWVNDIVVIDGFSSDGTVEVSKKYTNKVIQHKFETFAAERNLGIDNASGDWILQLDADEVVTKEFRLELEKILSGNQEFSAYRFRRNNFFLGHFMRYGGWYHYSLHFFKKGFARYEGRVHEDLIVDGPIGVIEAGVRHYPFDSLAQFVERQNRYSSLAAREMFEKKGVLTKKEIKYNLLIKPVKRFWKFYFKKKGYKEGMHGVVFSAFYAWLHFLNWAKYWELIKNNSEENN